MTEDDTFKTLQRIPFKELVQKVDDGMIWGDDKSHFETFVKIITDNHWKVSEYAKMHALTWEGGKDSWKMTFDILDQFKIAYD